MPEHAAYEAGVPSWVDLGSPDVEVSARFYGDLFGWDTVETGPAEETGGYRMFLKDGKRVAGLGPLMSEQQHPAWTTYVSTDDADATVKRVAAAGGQVLAPPMQVMDAGRLAMFLDATGALAGTWQPGAHRGAELVNEPGAPVWNELACRDAAAAKAFYGAVFGWHGETGVMGGISYTMWMLDGERIGGMLEMDERFPAALPAHWLGYFGVEDADRAAARIAELGGAIVSEPVTVPAGRFAVATDPHGVLFGVMALARAA